ncbi:response regulator [Mucilaginibacter jinjuensis]|uniref:Response regulator n=1 Tax=Mucilaginibacter jinjuensis TaxID=1176721 RepID=A0ABY7T2T1_9SPHI|nr:response regulator [Mucilaginibacter jinjuensis]WCT10712.1 response regulator [Mucilaginibacter jinjuensis]
MSKKIMIFDDDEDIQSICTFVLEEEAWVVKTFSDCSDIIARIHTYKPDVILMDNWIPDEGGVIATRQIKADPILKTIPVIYFSANSDIEQLAATAGADLYLPKPFDIDVLKQTVANCLSK